MYGMTSNLSLVLNLSFSQGSTEESMKELPFLGQIVGRLCWNPYVTVGGERLLDTQAVVVCWTPWQTTVKMMVMI